jgi:hypothetical protein
MLLMSELIVIVLATTGGAYLGLWLHELTHWLFGKVSGASPNILYRYKILPQAVHFEHREEMSDLQVRLAGGAVVFWLLLAAVAFTTIGYPESPSEMFLVFTGFGSMWVSPSDLLALLFPEQWQNFAEEYPNGSHRGAIQYLLSSLERAG